MIVFFTGDYFLGDSWSQVELLKYNDGTSTECDEPFVVKEEFRFVPKNVGT